MIRRLVVLFVLSLGIVQAVAAAELSKDELRMKEHLIALGQGAESLEGLRIEVADGSAMTPNYGSYDIADGKVVSQEWTEIGGEEKRSERAVSDEQVRGLLRELAERQYWTFQGTSFIPDADTFLFRFYYKDLKDVTYRCDAQEYQQSEPRSAIRDVFLKFVSKNSVQTEAPGKLMIK